MKKEFCFIVFLMSLLCSTANGQNPYQSIGKPMPKGKMLTLSDGKFQEFFPNDTLVPIGSVMYNTITGQVVAFLTRDTMYAEYNLEPEIVSRWLSPDPLAAKYPQWSPYVAMNNNPILYIDPDGKENIVVIGGVDIGQKDRYKFINSGLGQAFSHNFGATVVLVTANMTAEEITQVRAQIATGNANVHKGVPAVNLVLVESADEVANYFNSKSTNSNQISDTRLNDKVTDVSVFAHGIPGSVEFGYDYQGGAKSPEEEKKSFGTNQVQQLNPKAFDNAQIDFYTCNSATDANGTNLAKNLSQQTKSKVSGYEGQSTYKSIYGLLNRTLKSADIKMLPASNKPSAGDNATKKIYKNGQEE